MDLLSEKLWNWLSELWNELTKIRHNFRIRTAFKMGVCNQKVQVQVVLNSNVMFLTKKKESVFFLWKSLLKDKKFECVTSNSNLERTLLHISVFLYLIATVILFFGLQPLSWVVTILILVDIIIYNHILLCSAFFDFYCGVILSK